VGGALADGTVYFRDLMTKAQKQAQLEGIERARKALDNLPSTYQAVGSVASRMRRCRNPKSKLMQQLCDADTRLNNEGAEMLSAIRMALHFAKLNLSA
jgi:hypothetical protein